MSLGGVFVDSVDAIQAQSSALGVISQNIANVNTTGYKQVTENFQTLLSESSVPTNFFGVQPVTQYNNDVQGGFESTGLWDNVAINGPGFFILNSDTDGSGNTLYTRAGDFGETVVNSTDAGSSTSSGSIAYLTAANGDYLMGWAASNGVATTGTGLSGLSAVGVELGSTLPGQATSQITLQGSLPSNETTSTTTPAEAQELETDFTTTNATTTPGFDPNSTQVFNTGTLQIQLGDVDSSSGTFTASGTPVAVNITDGSLAGIASAINAANAGVTASVVQDSSGNYQLELNGANTGAANGFVITGTDTGTGAETLGDLSYSASNGGNYSTVTTAQDAQTGTQGLVDTGMPIYDNQFNTQTLQFQFNKIGSDEWTIQFALDPNVGTITQQPGTTTTTGNPPVTTTTPATITFDGAGNFQSVSGPITVGITWADGTTSTISVDLSKMSQLSSGSLVVNAQSQNGYSSATLDSAEIDSNGNLYGDYSNGQKILLYTVPVANFTAPNSLESTDGTTFQQTAAAGTLNVDAPTSLNDTSFTDGSVETSNVDLSDQFSRLITTQAAYNSATKVFTSADQMMQTLRDLVT